MMSILIFSLTTESFNGVLMTAADAIQMMSAIALSIDLYQKMKQKAYWKKIITELFPKRCRNFSIGAKEPRSSEVLFIFLGTIER